MGLVQRFYEKKLLTTIKRNTIPQHVVLVLDEMDVIPKNNLIKLKYFAKWCAELDISILTIFISIIEDDSGRQIGRKLAGELKNTLCPITDNIHLYCKEKNTNSITSENNAENTGFRINLAIGYNGRFELTNAIKKIMEKVERGELMPQEISENTIEQHLCIPFEPDLVIRSGGKRLTDFLIWQSAYSEFYFTDVNWKDHRRIDFLRAIRDYQKRQRRYGK
jgi:undecaprenyl diphosphate synthase